jgi:hypothetical protein
MLVNTSPFRETSINEIRTIANNTNKLKISKNEVSLQFLRSKDIGSTYKVEYLVNINSKQRMENPSDNLNLRDIDNTSLKKAIFDNITSYDQRYMELNDFDHTKATFHLKTDKWLDEATNRMRGKKKFGSFKMNFKLKQAPPRMIMEDALGEPWSGFVIRKIRQWFMDSKRREGRLLGDIFPKSIQRKIRQRLTNMFEWSYDFRWNQIEAQLESKWVIALLYAVSELTKKDSLNKLQNRTEKYKFSTKVKDNIKEKEFDRKKWKKFIKKKFY